MEQSSLAEIKILITDDSVHLRGLISAYLHKMGFTKILMATNGKEGIEQYTASHPDLVLLDYVMPEMNGIATLQEIRKLDPNATVLMITSISTKEKVLELKEAGAFSYLLKPFEEAKFQDIIMKAVEHIKNQSVKA